MLFRTHSSTALQPLPPDRQVSRGKGNSITAHRVYEAPHGHAALLYRIFSLVKVEQPDAIEMHLNRSVGRIAGQP